MKKLTLVIAIALIGALCFGCLAACGGGGVEGTYKFSYIEVGGKQYKSADSLPDELKDMFGEMFEEMGNSKLTIKKGGTYVIKSGDESDEGTWELSEDGKTLYMDGQTNYGYTVESGKLITNLSDGIKVVMTK